MSHTRRDVLATVTAAITLPLAGCAGGGYGAGGTTTTTPPMTTEEPSETTTTPMEAVELGVRETDPYGEVVVGPEGLALYMFEEDPGDGTKSVCTEGCADAWPPLTVESASAVAASNAIAGTVDTLTRPDGTAQVTLNGWPLYYFQQDSAPGDVTGQGVSNAWWLLEPNGTRIEPLVQVRSHSQFGDILTGPDGLTLYMFDQDTRGGSTSTCTGGCADAWPPLTVDSTDELLASRELSATVGTVERPDGTTQVAVDGWPVYYFQSDEGPGDVAGQGVQDVWWVLGPDGTVIRSGGTTQTTTTETGTTNTTATATPTTTTPTPNNTTTTTTTNATTTTTTTTESDDGGGGRY